MSAFGRVVGLKKPLSQYVGTQLRIPAGWWTAAVASKHEGDGEFMLYQVTCARCGLHLSFVNRIMGDC